MEAHTAENTAASKQKQQLANPQNQARQYDPAFLSMILFVRFV
jgi:hypothetical protein